MKARIQPLRKHGGICTKRLELLEGALVKDSSECWVSEGTIKTLELTLHELAELLPGLEPNQALVMSNADLGERTPASRAKAACPDLADSSASVRIR